MFDTRQRERARESRAVLEEWWRMTYLVPFEYRDLTCSRSIYNTMKRSFSQFDECIPPVVWEHFPEQKKALDRIGRAERDLQRAWTAKRRSALATNCEPSIVTKVMRVFVRSQFIPQTETEKTHFLVTIEGRMLESKLSELHHFGYFFDSIKLAVDKRSGSNSQLSMMEWDASRNPEGRKADCFRFKVYHDKACFVKFYLTRSAEVQPRYDLPPCVRDILPNIRWDPTEQDIFLAIWSYIMEHGLVDSRSKSLIKADEVRHSLLYIMLLTLNYRVGIEASARRHGPHSGPLAQAKGARAMQPRAGHRGRVHSLRAQGRRTRPRE